MDRRESSVMKSPSLRLPAPAKLNLTLRITGRRPDGYHDLQTVFQFVDVCDWLEFRADASGEIRLQTSLAGVPAERNLIVRAARLLKEYAGVAAGADIVLEKNLPMGGGLGGGSSNAATTLVALNRLWDLGLDRQTLMNLGLRLGADVPIFVFGEGAWAEGVGERLQVLELPEPWYVIVVPPCHVSTAEIFNAPDLTRDNDPITIADFLAGSHQNHCLDAVVRRYPVVGEAMCVLGRYSRDVRLTGTGACVYSVHGSEEEAKAACDDLSRDWVAIVASGRNLSPLYEALNER
ncbi:MULTISPECIES: 4-(cytidine 5'-diphospho)-2-C-methyl-D-erythritol kinase [Methylococcus]|uniref:4-diphosphocytidyl-2-C-methyl-D-erythritol kinase n=1 Tax=Methylococcus capsulatus (strain ATCC 33009 / NCIMB 11132 / Bath) TaxID=243233 RepID=ISPE_METCA|nr:4-(cytidine 5'-diphospho)-2-C-methyl-D-erythritol kinase [Methylococcus capsulatus]Q60A17.1 RecName: Full=4-diphosphocytidyl-2-C-methyl-D-erythritol kinase; Short=CMK; AltName: Full=4-(cytidine-5'-diphospho)-2-C-methyl-D-erythritol kinase [Methylococcus capsulatus str. Bath]AAU92702.1 4-diphosphocytidyl-2C-methyl-D-erythritol kinase [Methylococcus capsulatus str. Bath]